MNMMRRYPLVAGFGLSLAMCVFAATQSSNSGAQISSDQIKKQAAAQKKAAEAKEKWVKAQDKVKSKQADLEKAKQDEENASKTAEQTQR